MAIVYNKVTWYSKLAALIVFLIFVPILTFHIGEQYGLLKATQAVSNQ